MKSKAELVTFLKKRSTTVCTQIGGKVKTKSIRRGWFMILENTLDSIFCPVGQVVKTLPFHGSITSSILVQGMAFLIN